MTGKRPDNASQWATGDYRSSTEKALDEYLRTQPGTEAARERLDNYWQAIGESKR